MSAAASISENSIHEIQAAIVSHETNKNRKRKRYSVPNKSDPTTWPAIVQPINYDEYRKFIINMLVSKGNCVDSEAEKFTDPSAMKIFIKAVTHDSVIPFTSENNNYEMLEHFGDVTINKCITWYLKNRFPNIVNMGNKGVQIFSRQASFLKSKQFLSKFANKLNLHKFIQYRPLEYDFVKLDSDMSEELKTRSVIMDNSMREDAFEAFFAALEEVVDSRVDLGFPGVGYSICYKILSSIFDDEIIPTALDILVDSKTQLKEIFDGRKPRVSMWKGPGPKPANFESTVTVAGDTLEYKQDFGAQTVSLIVKLNKNLATPKTYVFNKSTRQGENADMMKKVAENELAREALVFLQQKHGPDFIRYK